MVGARVGTGFGLMAASVTLRAYNAAGHLIETLIEHIGTVIEPITAPVPSQPAAASSTPTR